MENKIGYVRTELHWTVFNRSARECAAHQLRSGRLIVARTLAAACSYHSAHRRILSLMYRIEVVMSKRVLDGQSFSHWKCIFINIELISRCHDLIVTIGSMFGFRAATRSGCLPVYVREYSHLYIQKRREYKISNIDFVSSFSFYLYYYEIKKKRLLIKKDL